ncbi:MAG: hypothetical protein DRJ68_01380 [Thermoprotei archaeon]|nr:MAG: hypothetical protein DRJ62_05310 [Thermoprotei archaeon]RLF22493.1 MAG: hypothetical protein DRJ68_01380 [Thermoprotei archaeon]
MCEFTVYLRLKDELRVVAKSVVKAITDGLDVKLISLLGNVVTVEGAAIESVDVPNEKLILVKR